jgi:hypothetical protein
MTLDPVTLALGSLYHAPAGILSGASVAVQVRNKLYIGSFMGDRLLEIDLSVQQESFIKQSIQPR